MPQLSTPTNVASIVVHQALAKSLDRFNAAFNQPQQPREQQGRQQPGTAYLVPDTPPPELTYAELLVSRRALRRPLITCLSSPSPSAVAWLVSARRKSVGRPSYHSCVHPGLTAACVCACIRSTCPCTWTLGPLQQARASPSRSCGCPTTILLAG